jgi:hypothetical protein
LLSQSSQSAQRKTVSSVDVPSTKETASEKYRESRASLPGRRLSHARSPGSLEPAEAAEKNEEQGERSALTELAEFTEKKGFLCRFPSTKETSSEKCPERKRDLKTILFLCPPLSESVC